LVAIDVGITHPHSADGDKDACSLYYEKNLQSMPGSCPSLSSVVYRISP
jgi:hypothetical protein